jgi:hypothetical protein
VELGATQWREAQPGQGRGKSAASLARRGSAVGNRRPRGACELAGAGYGEWKIAGSRPGRGLLEVVPWHGLPGEASSARWPAAAAPRRDRTGEGREERGRERRVGIQIKFSQNFEPKLEKL